MRKIKNILLIIIILILCKSQSTYAVTQDELYNSIQKTMYAYYRTGITSQYNSAKNHVYAPEEATSQDMMYSVCSKYTYNVMNEAFNVKIPTSTAALISYAGTNKTDTSTVLYYSDCATDQGDNCLTKSGSTMEDDVYNTFIKNLKPGDVIVYNNGTSGHALMVYEVYKDTSGKNGCESVSGDCYNARILNSTGGSKIYSKLLGTNNLFYNNSVSTAYDSTITNNIKEGTIKFLDLRVGLTPYFSGTKTKQRLAVLRFMHINSESKLTTTSENSKYVDNNEVDYDTSKAKLRSTYPDIKIEKIVDKIDNSIVNVGDTLTYTINIANDSTSNYSKFYIKESIDTEADITIKDIEGNGTINDKEISYEVSSLNASSTKTIKYSIIIKDSTTNIGKTITDTGTFSNTSSSTTTLTTGTVVNYINNSLTTDEEKNITNNYSDYSTKYSGAKLINELYKSIGINLDFENFKITSLIKEDTDKLSKCSSARSCQNLMYLADYNIGSTNKKYNDMILTNYWSALINDDGTLNSEDENSEDETAKSTQRNLFTWSNSTRSRNVNFNTLKTGDILVYTNTDDKDTSETINTNENGTYYYIYINDKFVGINNQVDSIATRNEFTSSYYTVGQLHSKISELSSDEKEFVNSQTLFGKDYYVIFRPALLKESKSAKTENVEVPDTFAGKNIIIILLSLVIIITGSYLIIDNTNILKKSN